MRKKVLAALAALLCVSSTWAQVILIADTGLVGSEWVSIWTIGGNAAEDGGPAQGYVQEALYGKIVEFKAKLPDTSVVAIRKVRYQMASTADVTAVKVGNYLRWYLDTTLLQCDGEEPAENLPSEFFEALVNSTSMKVVLASDMSDTYVTAAEVTIELDETDLNCP